MEKYMIFLEPTEKEGKSRSFIHSCRDSDAARDYAKFLLGVGCGNFHRAIVQKQYGDNSFQEEIDPIVFSKNFL